MQTIMHFILYNPIFYIIVAGVLYFFFGGAGAGITSRRHQAWRRDAQARSRHFNAAKIKYMTCVNCQNTMQSDMSVCPRCGAAQ